MQNCSKANMINLRKFRTNFMVKKFLNIKPIYIAASSWTTKVNWSERRNNLISCLSDASHIISDFSLVDPLNFISHRSIKKKTHHLEVSMGRLYLRVRSPTLMSVVKTFGRNDDPLSLSLVMYTRVVKNFPPNLPILRRPGDHTLPPLSLTHFTSSSITPSSINGADNSRRRADDRQPLAPLSICLSARHSCFPLDAVRRRDDVSKDAPRICNEDAALFVDRDRQVSAKEKFAREIGPLFARDTRKISSVGLICPRISHDSCEG